MITLMTKINPALPLERELAKQIYQALQGPVVESILKTANDSSSDDYWRSRMEGHCMKVERDILPQFYALCQEVKEKLDFKEPVDFYVTGDSSLNAFSVAAEEDGQPHIVNVNSAMFDLMSEDELASLFEPYFDVTVKVSDSEKYIVSGTLREKQRERNLDIENLVMLRYMLDHSRHHMDEFDGIMMRLNENGNAASAERVAESVSLMRSADDILEKAIKLLEKDLEA